MPAAGPQRFAAGAGFRRAVVAGALALVTTVLVIGCGSGSGPGQTREQVSKPASQLATTLPEDARPLARSDRYGRSQVGGSERDTQVRPESRPAPAPASGGSGKRFDYDVERIVREATAKLGSGDASTSSHSLRRRLTEDLEAALAGIPPDRRAAADSEGLAAAALKQFGLEP